jgi:hypothetical protein
VACGVLAVAGLGFSGLREQAFTFIEANGFYAHKGLPRNFRNSHDLIVNGYLLPLQQEHLQLGSPQGQFAQQVQPRVLVLFMI